MTPDAMQDMGDHRYVTGQRVSGGYQLPEGDSGGQQSKKVNATKSEWENSERFAFSAD